MLSRFLAGSLLTVAATLCSAEVLQNVYPLETLGEIKAKYPNARFDKLNVAWVGERDAFYSMTGMGLPGVLFIAFTDDRPSFREKVREALGRGEDPQVTSPVELELAMQSDEKALDVKWVRWSPEQPIPLDRYKAKYGPAKCQFSSATMDPICMWSAHGLIANMSDDGKKVVSIDTQFNDAEWRAAFIKRGWTVPDHLKVNNSTVKKPSRETAPK